MPSMRDIKRKRANVCVTRDVMKAIDMVSAAKLQKAKARLGFSRPLFDATRRMMERLKECEKAAENPFIKPRDVKNTAYVVITANRGLCGGYNMGVLGESLSHMNTGPKNETILSVGSKGSDTFKRLKKNVLHRFTFDSEASMYQDAACVSEQLLSLYTDEKVDEAFVAYTHYESTLRTIPRVLRVLPVADSLSGVEHQSCQGGGGMTYDPDVHSFLDRAMPRYLHAILFGALAESIACEHAARMINMNTATDNAAEIIDGLTRTYNRVRQAVITEEINEIVSSANILKSK